MFSFNKPHMSVVTNQNKIAGTIKLKKILMFTDRNKKVFKVSLK